LFPLCNLVTEFKISDGNIPYQFVTEIKLPH
jgi:hypothetical protein